jgi:hypothetical protein
MHQCGCLSGKLDVPSGSLGHVVFSLESPHFRGRSICDGNIQACLKMFLNGCFFSAKNRHRYLKGVRGGPGFIIFHMLGLRQGEE